MFGSLWLSIFTIIGLALMVAAIVLISPLLFAVVLCLVILGVLAAMFALGRGSEATTESPGAHQQKGPKGGSGERPRPASGGRPVSGEGGEQPR